MLLFSLALIAGLALLVWSADHFVNSSVATARNLGMTPMLIGLTVVAFGTSAPEMIVSATAAFSGASDLAIGNAIGSNIANIGLVLGVTAIISAIPIRPIVLRRELPVLVCTSILACFLLLDGSLSHLDGILLIAMLAGSLFILSRNHIDTHELDEEVAEIPEMKTGKAILFLVGSLLILLASSKLLVWSATEIARTLGVSELIIGLTIVAIGTSLPELAASVVSALKGHHDIALGNVIGSNLFNLLAVMAMPAFISQPMISHDVLYRDYPVMLAITFALATLAYIMRQKGNIGRVTGVSFVSVYGIYLFGLFLSNHSG
ncbi:MAG: calcium/sodium antiporter [Hahellaceae bacterium]|nr:calcium/sodium antiporter [Hahellaceae bacterium]MCP5169042.1 calcium/sodium antiporter [Hahellaceae bacterium]